MIKRRFFVKNAFFANVELIIDRSRFSRLILVVCFVLRELQTGLEQPVTGGA